MVAIKLEPLLFLIILSVTDGVRRITDGKKVDADKTYVVYLVKAKQLSTKQYNEWLCGGALVSTWFIITAAACVTDVDYMFAIAGYNEYIQDDDIETNECTKNMKKKVIYTCVPIKYEFEYAKVEKWSFIDIALAKVESEYNLNDATFKTLCSYIPTVISINYSDKFQAPGRDTLIYGWGHPKSWRAENDKNIYNERFLQFAASQIIDKKVCKTHYAMYKNMTTIIDQYMICTFNEGQINAKGEFQMLKPPVLLEGCDKNTTQKLNSPIFVNGEIVPSPNTNGGLFGKDDKDGYHNSLTDATRRDTNQTSSDLLQNKNKTAGNRTSRRNHGICQNDHGGPLITWVGGHEVLIGVASVFKVDSDSNCEGPYLFTSTQCNGAFINCILTDGNMTSRRSICDKPPIQRGYDTVERYISWENHPSGPADNQRNVNEKTEKESKFWNSTLALENLLRLNKLAKMAKDQATAILRQHRKPV